MDSLPLIQLPVVSTCWEEHRKQLGAQWDALFVHQVQHGERVVKVVCGDVGVGTRSGDESLDELPAVHGVGLESHVPAPHHCEQLLGGNRVAGLATCRRQQMEEDLVPLDTEPVDVVHEAKRSAWLAALSARTDEGTDDHRVWLMASSDERVEDVEGPIEAASLLADCGDEG